MLFSLHIENIAVIKTVDIDFSHGFSAFTGETGAGKSMIIDSINLLLGGRAERELLRAGEDRALVSAVFRELDGPALAALADAGVEPDEDGCIMLQRTLTADGRSAVRINGRAATVSVLREVVPRLINIHGQSETRILTDPQHHRRILDSYADCGEALAAYREAYAALTEVRHRIRELSGDESARIRTVEMLRYQIEDIDALSLREGEEERLTEKRARLKNMERIAKSTSFAYRALKGSEKGSVSYILSRTISALGQIADVIPEAGELNGRLEEYLWQIDDIAERVYDMGGEEEGDPTELLNRVESRLDAIGRLCRKYGGSVSAVLAFRADAAARLEELDGADEKLKRAEIEERACSETAAALAAALHSRRAAAAEKLQAEITETLRFLDMPRVRFAVQVAEKRADGAWQFDRNGYDDIRFLIATNPGESPAPMDKIASGGELSRIMLAIKSVIADKDGIATVIYDEVDAGVSGKTARKIGMKLRDSAARTQVLCVTHSAQIASLADTHYLIEKKELSGRAATAVRPLDREGRIGELSRILGGLAVTDAQRAAALDMLDGK